MEDKVTSSLEIISKMEPRKAAPVFAAMDEDLVLVLFAKLPSRQVTKILENMDPKKASGYLEKYTRIRSGREFKQYDEWFKNRGLCKPDA